MRRRLFLMIVVLAFGCTSGCQAMGEAFVECIFESIFPSSTKGTSREAGISERERRARSDEERIREAIGYGSVGKPDPYY